MKPNKALTVNWAWCERGGVLTSFFVALEDHVVRSRSKQESRWRLTEGRSGCNACIGHFTPTGPSPGTSASSRSFSNLKSRHLATEELCLRCESISTVKGRGNGWRPAPMMGDSPHCVNASFFLKLLNRAPLANTFRNNQLKLYYYPFMRGLA
jgi:hypothetical protein